MSNTNKIESLPSFPMKLSNQAKKLQLRDGIDFTPTRSRDTDAGFDVRACISESIVAGTDISKAITIPTGVFIDLEEYGQYLPANEVLMIKLMVRSGTKGLRLWNQTGLVDQGYHGELMLKMYNGSSDIIIVNPGDRIAQFTIEKALLCEFTLVDEFTNKTERGTNGFNSSGT